MPGTLVTFHAHPDDEAILTGGTMAKAAAAGHRVVLVVATKGELGERPAEVVDPDADLGALRVEETLRAAEVLGVARVEFLGFHDSGMMGDAHNDDAHAFWRADLDEAAARLAAILDEEYADALTVYDDHGGYGHPDHIQVHRVGARAVEVASNRPRLFEATLNRDYVRDLIALAPVDERPGDIDPDQFESVGSSASAINTTIDVKAFTDQKREAMRVHASQISESSFFLALDDDVFEAAFGTEWYIDPTAPPTAQIDDLFADPS